MRSSALQWEVAVSFPKDGHGSWGRTGMNIKHCASFLDRTSGRDSRKRTRGEGSQEARKETSFFKLIPSPKCSSQLPLQHEEDSGTISTAVREHLPGHVQKFARSFHTHPTLVLTIKNGVSVGCKEVWFGD